MSAALARAELDRGIAARDAGNFDAAKKAFEAVISSDPENPLGFLYLADLHLGRGNHLMALHFSKLGLALPCTKYNRNFGLQVRVLAMININWLDQALTTAREAIQNDPESAYNHRVLAQSLWAKKRPKAAEAAFQHALQLAPALVPTLTVYARFLRSHSRLREAREIIERATLVEPDAFDVILLRGEIAFYFDELSTAQDMALWALSRQATNRKALELLAKIKSRRSWLTAPYWWFANLLRRTGKMQRVLGFWSLLVLVAVLAATLPAQMNLPELSPLGGWLFWVVVIYVIFCAAHVSWLVKRDLKRVKLKKNF